VLKEIRAHKVTKVKRVLLEREVLLVFPEGKDRREKVVFKGSWVVRETLVPLVCKEILDLQVKRMAFFITLWIVFCYIFPLILDFTGYEIPQL